jgi:hypothetical protein
MNPDSIARFMSHKPQPLCDFLAAGRRFHATP